MKTTINWYKEREKYEIGADCIPCLVACKSGAIYTAWHFTNMKVKDISLLNIVLNGEHSEEWLNGWYEYEYYFSSMPKKLYPEVIEWICPLKEISESIYPQKGPYGLVKTPKEEINEVLNYTLNISNSEVYSSEVYSSGKDNITTVHVEEDMINHPSHYNHGRIETIDFIEDSLGKDGFVNYCLGNVLKYISRANFKGKHDEDIKKANWYLNKIVEKMEEKKDE